MSTVDPPTAGTEFVVTSELTVPAGSGPVLEAAFADRLREVEGHDGFLRLEVWRDTREAGRYLMVSWWRGPAAFTGYLRSDAHRRSHARIPGDPHRPRGVGVQRFEVVAR